MIELMFFALYAVAARFYAPAVIPAVAFMATSLISFVDFQAVYMYMGFAAVYLSLIPLAKTRIAFGMLASSIVNVLAACYFVSSLYLENFTLYFLTAMIVINTYILISVYRGLQNGKLGDTYRDYNYNRVGSLNVQTSQKTSERRP